MKTSQDIRNDFINFFKQRDHAFIPSAPVVPQDDPTLLFTNAGMNQFKAIFLGDNPRKLRRAANSQKCMRVSGKHNDLEEVGRDHYHHTFFEMLGNWSFGDYYKKEAIRWAWELITGVWKIDPDRLFATVYNNDDEAVTFWKSETGIPHERILRFGEKSNFWEMGETGPCGPCSEIHYDMGDAATRGSTFADPLAGVNGENARYRELWNLVFIQYNREKDGTLAPLAAKHVDTGMGFERIVAVIQGADSNYHTDVFRPVIAELEKISGRGYSEGPGGTAFRVAADHVRALVFAITDGAFPSNEGRGYVLRRLLRRASRFGRELGLTGPYLHRLVPAVVTVMGSAFPEIGQRASFVAEVIRSEEERFGATLEQGIQKFGVMIDLCEKSGAKILPGSDVFALYDTYGFPMDLTRLMASEKGIGVDEAGFDKLMNEQKTRAREARRGDEAGLSPEGWIELAPCSGTEFLGYEQDEANVRVCRYKIAEDGGGRPEYLLILDSTPFYASSGGQVGDIGELHTVSGKKLVVNDTVKWNDLVVHRCGTDGVIVAGDFSEPLAAVIGKDRRAAIRRNHSATHLLQAALRKVLGTHVQQSGSRVDAGGLRFDFTHFKSLDKEQIDKIEDLVNGWILDNLDVATRVMDTAAARNSGAMALFGEKYGATVRVVSMGDVSRELCGGTHVSSTGRIGLFHIIEESSIASGVRRIVAITGFESLGRLRLMESSLGEISASLKVAPNAIMGRVKALQDRVAGLEAQSAAAAAGQAGALVTALIGAAQERAGTVQWNVHNLGNVDKKRFSDVVNAVSDAIRDRRLSSVAIVLAGVADGAVMLAACAGPDAVKNGVHCGEIVKAAAARVQGSGGGSPTRAQAGGKDPSKINEAMDEAVRMITSKVRG